MMHEDVCTKTYRVYNGDAMNTIYYNSICAIERAVK